MLRFFIRLGSSLLGKLQFEKPFEIIYGGFFRGGYRGFSLGFKLSTMKEGARDHVSATIETASSSRPVSKAQNVRARGPNGL